MERSVGPGICARIPHGVDERCHYNRAKLEHELRRSYCPNTFSGQRHGSLIVIMIVMVFIANFLPCEKQDSFSY